jgi:DNA-binding XRE family transcriptional regulator
MSSFSDRLKQARVKAELTQDQLAERIGVHKFTVSKWEMGKTHPGKPTDYLDIALVLDVATEWLQKGVGEMGHYTPPPSDRLGRSKLRRSMPALETIPMDWTKMGDLVGKIHAIDPSINDEKMAKALRLLWVFAGRGQVVDADQVREILDSLE